MVSKFAWSERTQRTGNAQWKAWIEFCASDGRVPMPVTEAHLVPFFGWIKNEREENRRTITSRYIP